MRVLVGEEINVDKPVNLMDLKPLDRILYSDVDAFHRTKYYTRRIAQTAEKEEERKRMIRENLLDDLLAVIHQQITLNSSLKDKKDTCNAVLVSIKPKYVPYIEEVISAKDFTAYYLEHIKPDKSIAYHSNKLPHLIYIERRGDT